MNAPILASTWGNAHFTVAQIWALVERGLINEDARFELIDGEIREMSPKGPLHEEVSLAVMAWIRGLPAELAVLPETTLYLTERLFLEPDYVVFKQGLAVRDLKARDVKLAIEIGHESWPYDIGPKAKRYAEHGVQEYWAIHAPSRMTRIHRDASAKGWSDIRELSAGEAVVALCAPNTPLILSK
jgi:Uma2 family endonuclease